MTVGFFDLLRFGSISSALSPVRSSILDDKTEVILLQKLNEPLPLESLRRDPPKTAFTSNTGVCACVSFIFTVYIL